MEIDIHFGLCILSCVSQGHKREQKHQQIRGFAVLHKLLGLEPKFEPENGGWFWKVSYFMVQRRSIFLAYIDLSWLSFISFQFSV